MTRKFSYEEVKKIIQERKKNLNFKVKMKKKEHSSVISLKLALGLKHLTSSLSSFVAADIV